MCACVMCVLVHMCTRMWRQEVYVECLLLPSTISCETGSLTESEPTNWLGPLARELQRLSRLCVPSPELGLQMCCCSLDPSPHVCTVSTCPAEPLPALGLSCFVPLRQLFPDFISVLAHCEARLCFVCGIWNPSSSLMCIRTFLHTCLTAAICRGGWAPCLPSSAMLHTCPLLQSWLTAQGGYCSMQHRVS